MDLFELEGTQHLSEELREQAENQDGAVDPSGREKVLQHQPAFVSCLASRIGDARQCMGSLAGIWAATSQSHAVTPLGSQPRNGGTQPASSN